MSVFVLKFIAVAAMLCDHIGYVLLDNNILLRTIGRLTFPIMAYLIGNGFIHTRDVKKYITRLFAFAIISEPFFDLCFLNRAIDFSYQNVFFTLILGLLGIYYIDKYNKSYQTGYIFIVALCAIFAQVFNCDYGSVGVLMIILLYQFSQSKLFSAAAVIGCNILLCYPDVAVYGFSYKSIYQMAACLSLIPIFMYNGKKGYNSPFIKYGYYIFYPLHLFIIYIINTVHI